MRRLAVDQLAPATLGVLLLVQWLGADYFAHVTHYMTVSPFSQLWAAYSRPAATALMVPVLVGLGLGMLIPVGHSRSIGELLDETRETANRFSSIWLALATVSLAVMLYVKFPYILRAPAYLMEQGPAALTALASVLSPLGVLAAGALSTRNPRLGLLFGLAFDIILFASATRLFCSLPLLFLVGRYVSGSTVRPRAWAAVGVYAYLSLPIPLISRSQQQHGLIPYSGPVLHAIIQPSYVADVARVFGENVGMTVPLMIFVSRIRTITTRDMLISLNPMPSQAAGWVDIMPRMRVHAYIPFSALGEWASFGPFALLAFVFVWTVVVRLCVASVSRNRTVFMLPLIVVTIAASALAVMQIGQYNTRAIARLTDAIALAAAFDLVTRPVQARVSTLFKQLLDSPSPERTLPAHEH